jgi:hypothetical protein
MTCLPVSTKTVTAAQVEAGLTDDWCYSDAFKEIYGYRPRGEYVNSPEYVADFWNSFEENFAEAQRQDAEDLQAACDAAGIPNTGWMAYYDFLEAKDLAEREAYEAMEAEAAAEKAEFYRRGSPAPVLEAWAHGA